MKHAGKARSAGLKIIFLSLAAVGLLLVVAFIAKTFGQVVLALSSVLVVLWALFAIFTFNFFRDPDAHPPTGKGLIVSPAKAGKTTVLKDIATAISIEPDDLELSPFNQRGGLGKAHQLFGEQLPKLLDELNEALTA